MNQHKASLLIADGNERFREALRDYFSDCGFSVSTSEDGVDCLSKLLADKPAVLLIDPCILWGGDGIIPVLHEDLEPPERPEILVLGEEPRERLASRVGLPETKCYERSARMDSLLDVVSSMIALSGVRQSGPDESARNRLV